MVHHDEVIRVLLFAGVAGLVYVAAAVVLVRRFAQKPRPALRWKSKTILALAALGVLCMLYGRFVEPRWIEVTETRVPTTRLAPGHRGVRIVHLTDLHCDAEPRVEERLPEIVAALHPDLIVFTGDAANSREGLVVFRRCLTEIAKIAPTFAVKGNWEFWDFPEADRFGGTGARELDLATAEVDVAGAKVSILGAAYDREKLPESMFASLREDGPAVLLYHCPYPEVVPSRFAPRVDLICAGHVHGGQVALPWYGALLTLSKHGKKYERGLYRTDEGPWMYVSRGIGMEGGSAPRVRFCARPEVSLVELVPAPR